MSYDLMVFEKTNAPTDRKEFLAWYEKITKWDEEHNYDEPNISSKALRNWFMEMKETFPQMNGPYAPTEEEIESDRNLENHLADYAIDRDVIYVAFGWLYADDAYIQTIILAKKHGVGFFNVSSDIGEIFYPDTPEMEILEIKARLDLWHNRSEYKRIISFIDSMPEDKIDYDIILMKAVTYNNTKEFDKAIETAMLLKYNLNDDGHLNYVLGYAYYYQGKYEDCIKMVEKAISIDEYEKQNMDILAFSYYKVGRKEDAKKTIYEYIELKIDDDDYQHIVEAILEYPKDGRDETMEVCMKNAYKVLINRGKERELIDIIAYYSIGLRDEALVMLKSYVSKKIESGEYVAAKKAILEYPKEGVDDKVVEYLKVCEKNI